MEKTYIGDDDFLTKEQCGVYSIKTIKNFETNKGFGFTGKLYREDKKIANVSNDGIGGMTIINWGDMLLDRVEGECKNREDKIEIQKLTPEQKLFNEYIIKLNLYRHISNTHYPIIEDCFADELSYL